MPTSCPGWRRRCPRRGCGRMGPGWRRGWRSGTTYGARPGTGLRRRCLLMRRKRGIITPDTTGRMRGQYAKGVAGPDVPPKSGRRAWRRLRDLGVEDGMQDAAPLARVLRLSRCARRRSSSSKWHRQPGFHRRCRHHGSSVPASRTRSACPFTRGGSRDGTRLVVCAYSSTDSKQIKPQMPGPPPNPSGPAFLSCLRVKRNISLSLGVTAV